jgi:hypothetical protein
MGNDPGNPGQGQPGQEILVKTKLVRTIPVSGPARAIPPNNPVREILVREIWVKASRVKVAKATDRTTNVIQVRTPTSVGVFLG